MLLEREYKGREGCWHHKLVFLTCLLLTLLCPWTCHSLKCPRLSLGFEDSRVQEPRQALCWFEGADRRVLPEAAQQLIVWLLQLH